MINADQVTKTIPRFSVTQDATLLRELAAGPARPLLLTDATAQWPARERWTLDFFAREYGQQFGVVLKDFTDGIAGKGMTLGEYIRGMDAPLADLPGFWVDRSGKLVGEAPAAANQAMWGFVWRAFDMAPELRDDITPWPLPVLNIVARLDADMAKVLEDLSGYELYSLYIGRAGTVTALHSDHSHSIGSLAQFCGEKLVYLYDVADAGDDGLIDFNPEQPDFRSFAQMRGLVPYVTVLKPGEMVIIPPDWPHYVRALSHSITLSHNFFNQFNFSAFMRDQIGGLLRADADAKVRDRLAKLVIEGDQADND